MKGPLILLNIICTVLNSHLTIVNQILTKSSKISNEIEKSIFTKVPFLDGSEHEILDFAMSEDDLESDGINHLVDHVTVRNSEEAEMYKQRKKIAEKLLNMEKKYFCSSKKTLNHKEHYRTQ